MRAGKRFEITIWFLLLMGSWFFMTARAFHLAELSSVPDFLLALSFFAAYFYPGSRALSVCLIAGFLKDLSFHPFIGPAMLAGLFINTAAGWFFRSRFEGKMWPCVLQAIILALPIRFLRGLCFYLIPYRGKAPLSLMQRFLQEWQLYLRSLPSLVLALLTMLLVFYLLKDRLPESAFHSELPLAKEPTKLL